MNLKLNYLAALIFSVCILCSCNTDEPIDNSTDDPKLIFKFKFDPDQERQGNLGQSVDIPAGNAAQTPDLHMMGAHYLELSEATDIPVLGGTQITKSPTTTKGGEDAIDFEKAMYGGDGDVFFEKSIKDVDPGNYKYLRMSLSYQNYTIDFRALNTDIKGTLASFVGVNTYLDSYKIKDQSVTVNGNRRQGYWALETDFPGVPIVEGLAPEGATTVPNPLFASSPIPQGSCLVTGVFDTPFVLTGNETEDVVITCSISINNSFEWKDVNNNGTFEPTEGDIVVDMGTRGLKPIVEK